MNYSVCQVDPIDSKDEILKFWNENHPKPLEKKFSWIYEGNPDGKPNVWFIKYGDSEKVVGMTVLFPRKFSFQGKPLIAGISGDFLVDKKHRTIGAALLLQRTILWAVRDGLVDFAYGFPNQNAELIKKKAGFQLLGDTVRLVKPIKTVSQLGKLGWPSFLLPAIAPFLDFFLYALSLDVWYRWNSGFNCEEVSKFDFRFDRLWSEEKNRKGILAERTSDYLNWKYLEDPDDKNKVFAVFDRDFLRAKGYIVYRLENDSIEIPDFFFNSDPKVFPVLMAGFIRHIRPLAPATVSVSILEDPILIRKMKIFGFLKKKTNRRVYWSPNERLHNNEAYLSSKRNWFLTVGDQDT